jgi:hypothetical protein
MLFAVSLWRGFKWWHALALILIWAGIGDDGRLLIMYWIHKLPGFA